MSVYPRLQRISQIKEGFYSMAELFYILYELSNLAERTYRYIEDKLLDHEHGEWFWSALPDGTPDRSNDKAGFWKCPYHNSRMCLEIVERLG